MNILFLVFIYIVLVATILMSTDISTALTAISLIVSCMAIFVYLDKLPKLSFDHEDTPGAISKLSPSQHLPSLGIGTTQPEFSQSTNGETAISTKGNDIIDYAAGYSADFDEYQAVKYSPYCATGQMGCDVANADKYGCTPCYQRPDTICMNTIAESAMNGNERLTQLNLARGRDKRAIDGNVVRDARFYAFHYDNELELAEKRQWWGNHEW